MTAEAVKEGEIIYSRSSERENFHWFGLQRPWWWCWWRRRRRNGFQAYTGYTDNKYQFFASSGSIPVDTRDYMLLVMAFKHLCSIHSIEVLLIEYLQCERVQIRKSLRFLYYHQLSFGRLYLSVTQSIFLPSIALLCYNWQQKTTRRDPPPVLSRSVMNGGRWVIGWWITVTEENKVYPILFTEKSISNIQRNVNWISIGFA